MKIGGVEGYKLYSNYKNKARIDSKIKYENIKDKIEISDEAKKLRSYAGENSLDNSEKIEKLKEQIKCGTYKVDAKDTAKGIMKSIAENRRLIW